MPPWALGAYRYAYFMVGRVEDALRMQERKPRETYRRDDHIWRAMLLGAVGRGDEARAAVADTLARFPGVSVEGYARRPEWSAAEQERLTEAMREAGFPACATAEDLRNTPGIKRLPECEAERAKAAMPKT
jgi:hypothetical protein